MGFVLDQTIREYCPFLQLDLKLIWRNKRTKMQVFISLAMILYGLIFYGMDAYGQTSTIFLFVGNFMTGYSYQILANLFRLGTVNIIGNDDVSKHSSSKIS